MRKFLFTACGLLLLTTGLQALEALCTVKKVDAEKGVLYVFANGADRTLPVDKDAKFLADDGKPLADGLKAKEIKEGTEVTITVEFDKGRPRLTGLRLGKHLAQAKKGAPGKASVGKPSVGFKPLTEMTAQDKYKGEDGGLYGCGKNEPTGAHLAAAKKETARIVPLNADGEPTKDGLIGLVSISMSNATQEYSTFKQIADKDPQKSPQVAIVDCAQGGQAMAQWVDPKGYMRNGKQFNPWDVLDQRLKQADVSPKQVQVVWVKLANVAPRGELTEHGKKLQKDTLAVVQNAKAHFPNLRIAYLASRIYGGWADGQLNPEPYAYEGAFAARWLIQDQIKGDGELKFDDSNGAAKAPLLLWGPYFWADGTTPRKADKLVWERADLVGDGTHPSDSGRLKVANMLLNFFKEDPLAQTWFVKK